MEGRTVPEQCLFEPIASVPSNYAWRTNEKLYRSSAIEKQTTTNGKRADDPESHPQCPLISVASTTIAAGNLLRSIQREPVATVVRVAPDRNRRCSESAGGRYASWY